MSGNPFDPNYKDRNAQDDKVVGATPSPQPLYPTIEEDSDDDHRPINNNNNNNNNNNDPNNNNRQTRRRRGDSDGDDSSDDNDRYNDNNNNDDDYNGEDEESSSGAIILEPIIRDPSMWKEKSLLSSQDEIKEGDELITKITKTIGKTYKQIGQKVKDTNRLLENRVKESNKKVEGALTEGFDQIVGVVSKPVDIVRDQHHKRIEKHETHERAIWIKDKQHISKYECLDYVTIYNKSYRNEMYKKFNQLGSSHEWQRWMVSLFMGIFIGFIAYLAHVGVSNILYYKFKFATELISTDIWLGFLAYFTCNTVLSTVGSLLAVYYEPTAAGSGIPEVKGYLNGTKIPHTLKFKTLWTKLASMILAVSSNLQVGAEGPMIHIGAIVGNGFSQAQSKEFGFKIPFLRSFRNDKDKRDFVTSGAGAGVAAAFGAPLGGALFSLEEVSSFWSTTLTWRSFFACLIATFTMRLLQATNLTQHGLMIFDMGVANKDYAYNLLEFIPFLIIGVLGGFAGALFTLINVKVSAMRRDKINKVKSLRVLEVFLISTVSTILQVFLPLLFPCKEVDALSVGEGASGLVGSILANATSSSSSAPSEIEGLKQYNCQEGYYNEMAGIIFASNEEAITNLLSINSIELTNTHRISIVALLVFFVFYFVFAAYTAGCGISSGTFVPMIVIGAAYGRAIGLIVSYIVPNYNGLDPGAYAIMGAAAFMAGVSRLTISLTVILIETTNELQYLIPIMVTIMVAKWTADLCIHPFFDILIEMKYIPYLEPHPSKAMRILMAKHIMAKKPVFCREREELGHILDILHNTKHNGFPVVNNSNDRCVKGLILRSQLLMILERMHDVYVPNQEQIYSHQEYTTKLAWKLPNLDDLTFDPADHGLLVDLTDVMNLTVVTVNEEFAVSEAFQLFRSIGLRHMPVVNAHNKLKGIITKKDLLEKTCEQRYKELSHLKLGVDQLLHVGDD